MRVLGPGPFPDRREGLGVGFDELGAHGLEVARLEEVLEAEEVEGSRSQRGDDGGDLRSVAGHRLVGHADDVAEHPPVRTDRDPGPRTVERRHVVADRLQEREGELLSQIGQRPDRLATAG